jgi:creatinine amidohydrolase
MKGGSIFLERMRWPEVGAAIADGVTTVVIPCGAVEQHGPHLPLFVDAEHGTRLGAEVARRLGNALVAPTIRVGCSEHHMGFPGTISLQPSTFVSVCRDYCVSLSRHGFRKLCLLPSHGGNFSVLAGALDDFNDAVGADCTVVSYTDVIAVVDVWRRVVQEESELGNRVGGHADIAESSIMLELHPDLVLEDQAAEGYVPDLRDDVIERIIRDGFASVTPNGILGDARGMTPEIGLRCITELADVMAAHFAG